MSSSSVFQFRVALKRFKPRIYRDIQLPADMDFYAFHVAIQDTMGWSDTHLFEFSQFSSRPDEDDSIGCPASDEPDEFEPELAKGILIGDYFKSPKDKALYVYDLGDNWDHEIVLMKLLTKDLNVMYPRCVGGKSICPPEEAGDFEGNHLEIISDPSCGEYEEYMNWLKDIGYDVTVTKFDHSKVVMTDAEERWKTCTQRPGPVVKRRRTEAD